MAKKSKSSTPTTTDTTNSTTNTFNKGLIKDMSESFVGEGTWFHARNLINNSSDGDMGIVGNEPSNIKCITLTYTLIGAISIVEDYWALFSTNNAVSEIGLFRNSTCEYHIISRDINWGFKTTNLIIGESRPTFECNYQLYWADGLNPDRTLNIGQVTDGIYPNVLLNNPWPKLPYICADTLPGPCENCEPLLPLTIDIEKTRIASLMRIPCITINRGLSGGQLPNGSYYATIAYSVNQQRVTDYFNPSAIQPLFTHENLQSSLDINFSNVESDIFDEFQLVIVSTINQQTVAKIIGYYSTNTNAVSIDVIDAELESVPLSQINLRTPNYEKSEAMYAANTYLIRTGPTGKFDFNYQPLANQIGTEWVMVEYPTDFYEKGGNITGYMRDEQYCFWIRWVYNTGERSSSYHIPGREALPFEITNYGILDKDNIEYQQDNNYLAKTWEVVNTAYVTQSNLPNFADPLVEGAIVARGKMGYWESTEKYPADKPLVWNASSFYWTNTTDPKYDLCGKPIRHHKMPADIIYSNGATITTQNPVDNYSHVRCDPSAALYGAKSVAIRILGVEFSNIKAPVDNNGNIIPGIVGYEILRSSRKGNRTVVAKGIINNMRSYKVVEGDEDFPQPDAEEILYPNYVGNYLGKDHTLTEYGGTTINKKNKPANFLDQYRQDYFTFHSPDTTFQRPFLSANELKIYGELGNRLNMRGEFEPVPGHPKEKLLTSLAFLVSQVLAIGHAAKAVKGVRKRLINAPRAFNPGIGSLVTGQGSLINSSAVSFSGATTANATYQSTNNGLANLASTAFLGTNASLSTYLSALTTGNTTFAALISTGVTQFGGLGRSIDYELEDSEFENLPKILKIAIGVPTFAYYWSQQTDAILNLIRVVVPFRDYVLRSLCTLDLTKFSVGNAVLGNTRRVIGTSVYMDSAMTVLNDRRVNNLYRPQTVGLSLKYYGINDPILKDYSVQSVGSIIGNLNNINYVRNYGIKWRDVEGGFFLSTTSCFYAGLKVRYRNQYGQIDSPAQQTTGCVYKLLPNNQPLGDESLDLNDPTKPIPLVVVSNTPTIYGGDVYIGRYTEKNTFFYFYDWLYMVPDGTEIDYTTKYMISFPRFFADFFKYDVSQFLQNLGQNLTSLNINILKDSLPEASYNLDTNDLQSFISILPLGLSSLKLNLGAKKAYMYLFQSGIRDFYVETEYNVDFRDYGDLKQERFYDPYGYKEIKDLFDTDIIKIGNYYKYDISLGLSKTYNNNISWGDSQSLNYDPFVAETCYQYLPNRVIYSLPQTEEDVKDYWRVFLVNNYKDFDDQVTAFKSTGKNGAIILFKHSSPVMFATVNELQTTSGVSITIGDGALFSQPLQSLNNADVEFQHGSCQDRLSVINTPAGMYWMSASQGKIFTVSDGMSPISDMGLKWWFGKYLKYFILDQFPDFDVVNNPVAGVGCQATYDNNNGLLYFTKKDFKLKDEFLKDTRYVGNNYFIINSVSPNIKIKFGDSRYFDDLSWTISFDTKTRTWVSFHDWHPEYMMSSIRGLITVNTDSTGASSLWNHNNTTTSYCNFYGVDYPFEIDYISSTGQTVNSLRSVEYILESYVYDNDGIDRFQVLDYNFDEAVVYNTEQVSGLLKLNIIPKNNAPQILNYPQINLDNINILYSKEEQKIRFNQFWDITRNRGEFFNGVLVQQTIWNTELNGYIRNLNANNLNYNKAPFERKKFRHYVNHVVLKKNISNNVKMLLKVTNNKLLYSAR